MEDDVSRDKFDIKSLEEKCSTKTKSKKSKCLEKRDTSQNDDKEGHGSKIRSKEKGNGHQYILDGKKKIEFGTQDKKYSIYFHGSIGSDSKPIVTYSKSCAAKSASHFKQKMFKTFLPKFIAIFNKYLPKMEEKELEEIITVDLMNVLDEVVVGIINHVRTHNFESKKKKIFKNSSEKKSERYSKKRSTDYGECVLNKKSKRVLIEKLESELSDNDFGKQPKHKKYKMEENVKIFVGSRSSEGNMEKRSSMNNSVVDVEVCDIHFKNASNIVISDANVKINESYCSNKEPSDAEKNNVGILDLPDMFDNLHMKQ